MSVDYEIPGSKRITVKTMNTKSIDRAIKEIRGRKRFVERRVRMLSEMLAQRGEEIARERIAHYTNGTGNLAQHIKVWTEYVGGKFKTYIELDTPYAAYVEFGTGIIGAGDSHPRASQRWAYDVNGHGEAGWVYQDDAGEFHWTQGEPAKPIMYETLQQLKQEFPEIVKEVFEH